MKLSIVTVCKGRLHHLRETAPLIAAQNPDEHIIVDYDCQDHCGDWVNANIPSATVVRATDPRGFCVARGRNLGAAAATGDWIFFIDADVLIEPGLIEWIRANASKGHFYKSPPFPTDSYSETEGSFVCTKENFEAVGEYDEAIRGWGREDTELYWRLDEVAQSKVLPEGCVTTIRHSDGERAKEYDSDTFTSIASKTLAYIKIKRKLNKCYPINNAPTCCREALFAQSIAQEKDFHAQTGRLRVQIRCQDCVAAGAPKKFFNVKWGRRFWFFGPQSSSWID